MDKSRNHPYNPLPQIGTNDMSYSPLIKGLKSVTENGAYMNSYINYRDFKKSIRYDGKLL